MTTGSFTVRGYLSPRRSALTCGAFRHYFASYCGLCQRLRQDYGLLGRLLVNRDALVLQLLCESQSAEPPAEQRGRCVVNPWAHPCQGSPRATDYAAAVSVLLFFAQLADAGEDATGAWGWLTRLVCRAVGWLFGRQLQRAERRLEALHFEPQKLHELWLEQRRLERRPAAAPSVAACAEPTARGLGLLFAHTAGLAGAPESAGALAELGRSVGTMIYLLDACDDLAADRRRGRFNPLLLGSAAARRAELRSLLGRMYTRAARLITELRHRRHGVLLWHLLTDALRERIADPLAAAQPHGPRSPWRRLRALFRPVAADCDCGGCDGCDCCCEGSDACDCCDADCCFCAFCLPDDCGNPCPGKKRLPPKVEGGPAGQAQLGPNMKVFASSADGYWHEARTTQVTANHVAITFTSGQSATVFPHQVTTAADPSPAGYETVTPGTAAQVSDPQGQWHSGTIVARFGRIFNVKLPDGRAVWCDTSKLRIGGGQAAPAAQLTHCLSCGAPREDDRDRCKYCGTKRSG